MCFFVLSEKQVKSTQVILLQVTHRTPVQRGLQPGRAEGSGASTVLHTKSLVSVQRSYLSFTSTKVQVPVPLLISVVAFFSLMLLEEQNTSWLD